METESGIQAIPANGATFGMTSNEILRTQMESTERNKDVHAMLDQAYREAEYGNIEKAKELKAKLEEAAEDISELVRLDLRISRKKVVGK